MGNTAILTVVTSSRSMKGKFPNGLAAAIQAAGSNYNRLARNAGTSRQNVQRWAEGERKLSAEWAEKLAPFLERAAEDIFLPPHLARKGIAVPVISWVGAGKLLHVESVAEVATSSNSIIMSGLPEGDWFALIVSGDSMDRVAVDGSIIVVNRNDQRLFDDRFYVFASGNGDATFKRYRSKPDRMHPFSTNPDHETLGLGGTDMHVVGRVMRVITDLW
jgi:SOS-response transcriptional repressor LexA